MAKPAPSRVAAALDYLERLKSQAAEFGGGVVENLADRARSVGGLTYEALATDPNMGRMTTAEYAQAASRPTPRLDQAAQDLGTIGRAIVTQPLKTGQAIVQGEIDRAQEATTSPRAAGEYAGSFIDPMRIAAALRRTAPVLELDVYHGTPHRFPATEANPLGEFDASKIGTGEGAQAYGHGIYYAENPDVAKGYADTLGGGRFEYAGEAITGDSPKRRAVELLWSHSGEKTGAIDDALNVGYDNGREIVREIKNLDFTKIKKGGSLYKADLPDRMIDRMLDWDAPVDESVANKIINAVRKNNQLDANDFEDALGLSDSYFGQPEDGRAIYKLLVGSLKSDEKASEFLNEIGIPGIKYADAGSRGQGGSGTRNFVVFPGEEKKVRILERK